MTANHVDYPTIHGGSTVQAYARSAARALVDKDAAAFAKDVASYAKLPLTRGANYTITSQVTINTPHLVSVSCAIEFWNGYASHSFSHFDSCTIGLVHGRPKVLTVYDLFRNRVDANRTSEHAALAALARTGTDRDLKRYKKVTDAPGLIHSFFITRTAIVFVLDEHTVLAHHLAYDIDEQNDLARVPFAWLKAKLQPFGPISNLAK